MKTATLMLIGYASSAKTALKYSKEFSDDSVIVPKAWLEKLAEYAEAAEKEHEEG